MANIGYDGTYKFDDDWIRKLSMGQVPNWYKVRKFGSGTVGTVLTTVWSGAVEQAGLYVYPPDAGVAMEIYSTNINDTLLGTGARRVQVYGIGPNVTGFQNEIVSLNGTTPVTLAKQYSRVFRAIVIDTGDTLRNKGNIGDIHITNTADTVIYAHIEGGDRAASQTHMALWTLPYGYKGYFASNVFSTNNAKQTSVYVYTRKGYKTGDTYREPFQGKSEVKVRDSTFVEPYFAWEELPGGTDIEVRGETVTGTDNIAAQFYIFYYKE